MHTIAYVSDTKDTYNQTQILLVTFIFFHIFQRLTVVACFENLVSYKHERFEGS